MVRKGLYLVHRFGLPASSEGPDGHERGKGVSSKDENNNNNKKKPWTTTLMDTPHVKKIVRVKKKWIRNIDSVSFLAPVYYVHPPSYIKSFICIQTRLVYLAHEHTFSFFISTTGKGVHGSCLTMEESDWKRRANDGCQAKWQSLTLFNPNVDPFASMLEKLCAVEQVYIYMQTPPDLPVTPLSVAESLRGSRDTNTIHKQKKDGVRLYVRILYFLSNECSSIFFFSLDSSVVLLLFKIEPCLPSWPVPIRGK